MQLIRILLIGVILTLALGPVACGVSATPTPVRPPGPGPTWNPREAINAVESSPGRVGNVSYSGRDISWNAEFDPYAGRWRVTAIYQVQALYPPHTERKAIHWYVYEDTGLVEGPTD